MRFSECTHLALELLDRADLNLLRAIAHETSADLLHLRVIRGDDANVMVGCDPKPSGLIARKGRGSTHLYAWCDLSPGAAS